MTEKTKFLWVKLTSGTIVGGQHYDRGVVLEVSADIAKQLIRDALAVPTGERGRMLTTATVSTEIGRATR